LAFLTEKVGLQIMAKPQVRAVYSTDFTPQNAVAAPKPAPVNEKAVVKQYVKRMAIALLKKILIACLFMGVGAWLESKYHIVGASTASVQAIAKKGAK